jgi:hypothetical protein
VEGDLGVSREGVEGDNRREDRPDLTGGGVCVTRSGEGCDRMLGSVVVPWRWCAGMRV